MKSKFFIKTLGCKTNQAESQIIAGSLLKNGYYQSSSIKEADIYIINSCTVTAHSDIQTMYFISNAKKQNPHIKIVLTGCMAQTAKNPENIDVDLILGNNEKLDIVDYLHELTSYKKTFVENIFQVSDFKYRPLINPKCTRPSIKIQEGCNNRCSYCLIPYARGSSRSNSIENIKEQINMLASNGYKEVVLTGTHIGQWGAEFGKNLLNLLKEIEQTDILRYRLGSLYTNEIDDSLLIFLSSSKKFCPHFHLSLQSLCDATLKNMNRNYTKASAVSIVKKINEYFNLPFIGCDIITGFPNESESDFKETYDALMDIEVSYIHSFPYSEREGTPAFYMSPKVPVHIRHERTMKLIELSKCLHKTFLEKNRDNKAEVLYENICRKNGLYTGVTRNYIKVYKKSPNSLRNTLENVSLSTFENIY